MKPVIVLLIVLVCGAAVVTSIGLAQRTPTTMAATSPATLLSSTRASTHGWQRHSSGVSDQPAQGTAILTPSPMPRDFNLLAERNIFIKGRQIVDPERTDEVVPSSTSTGGTTEANLVFSGAIITEEQGVAAFIEDTSGDKVNLLHVGDAVARGKITAITLDYLDYESNGKTVRVTIGQNLQGGNPIASTQPAGTDSGNSSDSVLERMRQRRLSGQ